jgi:hypothetical protein
MGVGEDGLPILAAQQLVEEDYRSDLASVTTQHLQPVADIARETFKKFNIAMSRVHALLKVLFCSII